MFDETTFETNRPGVYLAGTVCGGLNTSRWFIENGRFHARQIAAHIAAQVFTHHEPYRMADRDIGVAPADIIWGNLGLNPYEKRLRMSLSAAATAGLIIGWAIPGESYAYVI